VYKVFLADDEVVIREGIRNNFPWEKTEFALVGEAPDGEIALSIMQDIKPDVLITDIRMPFMDGLALCRHTMRAMPWMQIIILSGYDDFEYAREAISLGVKEYLLKPVSAQELEEVLRRIARNIEEERRQQADYRAIRRQLDRSSGIMKEKLILEVITSSTETENPGELYKRAYELQMNLAARCYRVMLIAPADGDDMPAVRAHAERLAEKAGDAHLCETGGKLALLLQGDSLDALEERAFAFAQAVKHEVESVSPIVLRVAIGSPAQAIKDAPASYASAGMLLRAMASRGNAGETRIMDAPAQGMDAALTRMDGMTLYEKVKYAPAQDVPGILRAHIGTVGGTAPQSMIMMNYLYVDIVLSTSRIIRENGGDPAAVLPEELRNEDNIRIFSTLEAMEQAAGDMLRLALAFRDRQSMSRYGEVIRSACAFIEQNYSDPNITLGSAAAHAALSNNHFCTVFSQEMGYTFIEYLTHIRMKRAKELLRTTEMRSADVAAAVGYNDPHYFSYLFKKTSLMNPRDYRNSCRAGAQ
jgi:two-component system, response regulator YesN